MPIADETGLILPLGRFVLTEACKQLAIWRRHPRGEQLSVSVNVSGRQLADPGFVELVTGALAGAQLDPRGLRLEVAESSMMEDPDAARRILGRLFDEHSVAARIDDFGTRRLVGASAASLPRRRGQARPLVRGADARGRRARWTSSRAIVGARPQPRHGGDRRGRGDPGAPRPPEGDGRASTPRASSSPAPLDAGAATALLERGTADAMT